MVVVACLLQASVLLHPERTFFSSFPLSVPDAFADVPRLKRYAVPLLLCLGAVVLLLACRWRRVLLQRPLLTVAGIYLLGILLHLGLQASLRDGFFAMEKRALSSGHGEYLVQAVSIDDLPRTLEDYEPYVRQYDYLSNKGQGVLILFYGLKHLANAPPMRGLLEGAAPSRVTVRWWLAESGYELTRTRENQLRYLLALLFVLFPLLTFLPVFLIFALGRAFMGAAFGLLAASLYPLVPAIALLVAHLDYAVFPLCTMAIVTPFAIGLSQRRPALIALAAAAFILYFTMTLSALSLVVLLAAYTAALMLRRLRNGEGLRRVASDVAAAAAVFALVGATALSVLYLWLHFDPIERYSYARSIQKNWGGSDYNLFWVTANLLGYFLSFGLAQTLVLIVEHGRALRRVVTGTANAIDDLAIAWLCLLIALVAFGRQHGETNRLWTFLSPLGCVIIARSIYDFVQPRHFWIPLALLLIALMVARTHLSYF